MADADASLSWEALKARARELRQGADPETRSWQIRVHRSLSWLKHANALPSSQPEARFVLLWIGLNSLYSAWDNGLNRPVGDSSARNRFLERVVALNPKKVVSFLRDARPLLRGLLKDPCLTEEFWRNPHNSETEACAAADAQSLDADLRAGRHDVVLKHVMDRLFVLRGQIVHGASTAGGALNRSAVGNGLAFIGRLLPVLIHIVLERGREERWPDLCYPPLK